MCIHTQKCFLPTTTRHSKNIRTLSEITEMHGGNKKKNLNVSTDQFWWRPTVLFHQRTATKTGCTPPVLPAIRDAHTLMAKSVHRRISRHWSNRRNTVLLRKNSSTVKSLVALPTIRYLHLPARLLRPSTPARSKNLSSWQDAMDGQTPAITIRILPEHFQKMRLFWLLAVPNTNIIN